MESTDSGDAALEGNAAAGGTVAGGEMIREDGDSDDMLVEPGSRLTFVGEKGSGSC